LRQSQFVGSR
uniref:Urechistachykinin-1 n=1 Tax=Urechis unicinctus TaxID=6432 RepID=TKU1_UREUN|nr:RecName: Full=Urechistachykinin-1; AltName: Full=Urechistachykinin I [Urechis unicinctus]AAB26260.1 urechistachykinin I=neuropeptide [Urechis unicinctus=echiuroid worms, ventral nerve cords, Peptide, 10 aa] [Urechis unicinctus]